MRKNAAALENVAAMIAGEEGAEARMAERIRDVESHIQAGPFTREALGEIAKGWAKDIPVLGQIVDVIFSVR